METNEHIAESIILMILLEEQGFEFVKFENPNFDDTDT